MSEWTEGVCSDGAAILRDGKPVPISELIEHMNRCESIRSAALEDAAKVADDRADQCAECYAAHGQFFRPDPHREAEHIASLIRSLKDTT